MADVHPASALWPESIKGHWKLFLIEGIVLVILGIGAMLIPIVASLAVAIFLGWLFLVGGIVGAVTTLMGRNAPGFWWSLISAAITIIAGLYLVGWPVAGAVSLTIVLAAYLVAEGIASMLFAYEHRRQLPARWGWLFLNGIIDLFLAGIIVWLLPLAAVWALGLIVGIDFIFGGASLVGMALAARDA
ncbi:MAG TPA: HdeD family acid-resistance protein [Micropepsaceae bacterium]|nr:HdeD family acid-resistance protein [Micropepsaceae bacterium]